MNGNYSFRAATEADIPALVELGLAAYGQYGSVLEQKYLEMMLTNIGNHATWAGILAKAHGTVVISNEAIVGMAFLLPSGNPWDIFPAHWSYIRMMAVHPAHQGQGICHWLTSSCIAQARQLGERTIALHTSEMMEAARHIYEKLGFRQLREIPERLGKRYWIYIFVLHPGN